MEGFILSPASYSSSPSGKQFHADVLQLVHDGRAGLQFWVQYHPLFAPGPDGLPGLHALRDPALTDLTSTTWPTFLDALAGHIRDFHDLVAVGLSDGRTTLTFVTAEVVTRLVVPALRALVARENRPTGAEHLALIADVFHRSLAWIDAAAALPRVALLPDYVRLALFTPCTDLIRTQLVAERQYVEGQYEARRVAHPTVGGDFSQFISLELALDMLHLNKAALARVAVFWIQAPAAWAPRDEILACAETLFVLLVRHLATHHLRPAFTAAIARLTAGAAAADPAVDLAQLDQFLALVHVADLIVQMVEVYHKQEMLAFVDEYDFLSAVNQEKRSFETGIDDQAAAGLDRVIDRLMDQVAHLLRTTQRPDAFTPPADRTTSVQPTPTCQQVLACLSCCTSAVTGATDKHVVDVFLGEVALRLFNVLSEHLKRFRVDPETGAVQLMADLNAYHGWATRTLRNPDAIRYFDVLKEVGNLYLVTPQHLRSLLLDGSRFEPVLRVEEAYEFVILRTDYARIKGMVEDRCAFM
ncbi:F-box protein: endocytic membrane traffic, recycling ReCYcling 1 [Tieghemiomyces parasiticus]|uniref:F-box protein: endocytic membrane traffic, recycling ReCYcling 1 n=1 Tax=Tieghemiomyces parasiticus TaxID=78921 RepID=A0A9W8E309_9FUNG|nr:F-box protein: endocytic membrane traffic, recycling ReCYcling 1 [Tieghemiomyces parasiticus]